MFQKQIEKRPFGRTGHLSTAVIFGAAALSRVSQKEADWAMENVIKYGINHLDTAASYGEAELRLGPWMAKHRPDFFLATKTEERTYQPALDEIRRSLERLQVDNVDLLQLHNLSTAEEWELAMGPGGALEAAIEARNQGLVRFIGVTGHGTQIAALHQRSLERFDFVSVLLPYNYVMMQNPTYAADFESLMTLCEARNVAVQTIKSICRRPWGKQDRTRATWYEPLENQADIDLAVQWVLSRPSVFLNMVGDIYLQPKVMEAAAKLAASPPKPAEATMQAVAERLEMAPLFV